MPAAGANCCCSLWTAFFTDRTNKLTRGILRLPNCLRTGLLLLFSTSSTTNSKGVNSTLVYCLYKHTTVGKTNHGIHFLPLYNCLLVLIQQLITTIFFTEIQIWCLNSKFSFLSFVSNFWHVVVVG